MRSSFQPNTPNRQDLWAHWVSQRAHIVTRNCPNSSFNGIDYYKLARPLDFISWDNYPNLRFVGGEKSPVIVSLSHDLMRGLKGKSFWVTEEQSGPSGWQCVDPTPYPGEIRLWTYQAIAHGAEGILYFRWRTSRFGTEQFWHGILDHSGIPTRRYEEVKKVGWELKRIGEKITGLKFPQKVAMLTSYDEQWAFEIQPNNPKFNYQEHFASYYRLLNAWNIPVDVVSTTRVSKKLYYSYGT